MFRVWGKLIQKNKTIKDYTACIEDYSMTRTNKVYKALDEICYEFDLQNPIWLDSTVNDFKRHARTRFNQDCFIEEIDFDYLEIQVIEED